MGLPFHETDSMLFRAQRFETETRIGSLPSLTRRTRLAKAWICTCPDESLRVIYADVHSSSRSVQRIFGEIRLMNDAYHSSVSYPFLKNEWCSTINAGRPRNRSSAKRAGRLG